MARHFRDLDPGLNPVLVALLFPICLLAHLALWAAFVYRLRPSLSHVPGPLLARWSRLWIAKALASGKSHEIWNEVNAKYGSVARIGPNHVITDDPDITRRVLAARSGYVRGPFFDSIRTGLHISNIVSERDPKKHAAVRSKMAPSFSGTSIAAMEPHIDQVLVCWIDNLRKRFAQPESPLVFDVAKRVQFLMVDIITKLTLGHEIGCVKNDRDMHGILRTVEVGNQVAQYCSVFVELNGFVSLAARIPFLQKTALFPKTTDKAGIGRLMGVIHETVQARLADGPRSDVVSALLDRGMPASQINSEIVVVLGAGSDTTATSVQATLLAIITDPRVYATLRAEISAALASGRISTPIRDAEAKQLAYLQACVLEGIRRFPPLSQLRDRVVPPGGDMLGVHRVPAGTFVGLNTWSLQSNKAVYGDDANLFRPERWLTQDEERLKAMHQLHTLIFGHGATKCLGMSLAAMEIPKILFELLRNFDIAVANPYRPWVSRCSGIFFQTGFDVRLTARHHEEAVGSAQD